MEGNVFVFLLILRSLHLFVSRKIELYLTVELFVVVKVFNCRFQLFVGYFFFLNELRLLFLHLFAHFLLWFIVGLLFRCFLRLLDLKFSLGSRYLLDWLLDFDLCSFLLHQLYEEVVF